MSQPGTFRVMVGKPWHEPHARCCLSPNKARKRWKEKFRHGTHVMCSGHSSSGRGAGSGGGYEQKALHSVPGNACFPQPPRRV